MKLIIVIVNYATSDFVLSGLKTLVPEIRSINNNARWSNLEGGKVNCWIIDNNSPDDSYQRIQSALISNSYQDCVAVFPSGENAGFGAGNNFAFRKAAESGEDVEYFYLLNPDACIESGTIDLLVNFLDKNPLAGIVGGSVLRPDGSYECGAFRMPTLRGAVDEYLSLGFVSKIFHNYQTLISPPPAQPTSVGWVSGANMMIRRSVLERSGYFDEGYFLYFEEVDLCKRVADLGYQIYFLPEAKVVHEGGASTNVGKKSVRYPRYWHDSRSRFFRKNFGSAKLHLQNFWTILACLLHRTHYFLRGKKIENPHFIKDLINYNYLNSDK